MSEPRTPQVPMVDRNGEPFYPLTQYNQIVMPDGSRWNGEGGGAQIDDTSASAEKVYSSQKVESIASQLSQQMAKVLPAVTAADAGKFLRVSDSGVWAAETIPSAEGANF